jgi:hypothetical protein
VSSLRKIDHMDPVLRSLPVEGVATYLRKNGWKLVPHPNERIWLFVGASDDEGQPLELILPRHADYVDSLLRLSEALNLLAAVEGRASHDIVQSIQAFSCCTEVE